MGRVELEWKWQLVGTEWGENRQGAWREGVQNGGQPGEKAWEFRSRPVRARQTASRPVGESQCV